MSRIGIQPVAIPNGVEVTLNGQDLAVKGSKGQLAWVLPSEVEAKQEDGQIVFAPRSNSKQAQMDWGLARSISLNMVQGVSEGFEKKLTLKGVGYRANMQGTKLNLSVGYSHPVVMDVPAGLTVAVNDNTEIVITGCDKQLVGQFAANVRSTRPPEPYKGKGVRYSDEHVIMKEGKKK